MIGTIYIKCNAQNPNIPLQTLYAFKGSPSSLRIIDVPKKIGNWKIDSVFVQVNYPDNTATSYDSKLIAGCYVSTIPKCDTVGKSLNGYAITANGTDEDGNQVSGYVLGKGDVIVLDSDSTIHIGTETIYLHLIDSVPTTPNKGDVCIIEGEIKLYDGTEWKKFAEYTLPIASSTTLGGIKVGAGLGIAADGTLSAQTYELPIASSQTLGGVKIGTGIDVQADGTISASIPTKTSQLDNDSGFLSAHQSLSSYAQKIELPYGYSALTGNNGTFNAIDNSINRLGTLSAYVGFRTSTGYGIARVWDVHDLEFGDFYGDNWRCYASISVNEEGVEPYQVINEEFLCYGELTTTHFDFIYAGDYNALRWYLDKEQMSSYTIVSPIPASDKVSDFTLRFDTADIIPSITIAAPTGKSFTSFDIEGDDIETSASYMMAATVIPTLSADSYELVVSTRKMTGV